MALFKSSGRLRRHNILSLLFVGAGIGMIYFLEVPEHLGLGLSLLALMVVIGIILCLWVNCPSCGKSWLYYALSKQKAGNWLSYLYEMEECPHCGYSGQEK